MWSDVRDAFRALTRDRSFAGLAIVLLALTIGVTAAVYAIVHAVILQPWTLGDPARTVVIWHEDVPNNVGVEEVAIGEAESWRRAASSFDAVGVFSSTNSAVTLTDDEARPRASYALVSASFFAIAGVAPAMGRVLERGDETGRITRVAVISAGLWARQFGADPHVVGRTLHAQFTIGAPPTSLDVVGVMPDGFDFPRGTDFWLPAAPAIRDAAARVPNPIVADIEAQYLAHFRVFYGIGHLRPGATPAQAAQDVSTVIRHDTAYVGDGARPIAIVTPIADYLVGPTKPALWTMLAGAALMVLLACSSVAGLHLFRSARQDRAIAVQLAIGASPARLVRRSVIESGLLAAAGSLGAVAVAVAVTRVLMLTAPLDVPRLANARVMTTPVLIVAAGLATLACVLSGLWPALFIRHVDPGRTLTSGARTALHPRERLFQRIVVGWQVTVAVILLSGAALFVRSVRHLGHIALGFTTDQVWAMTIEPATADQHRWDQFYDALLQRTRQLPYVDGAGAVYLKPLSGPIGNDTIPVLKGQEGVPPNAPWLRNPHANLESITPGYFHAIGTRLLAGRDFTDADRVDAPGVTIVSASAAARYWPGRDPIGQPIIVPTARRPGTVQRPNYQTVVGVVEDVRYRGITDPRLDLYLPAKQSVVRVKDLMVRTHGETTAARLTTDLRAVARGLDANVRVGTIVAMRDVVAQEIAPWRFAMRMLIGLGAMAAVLATVGLIGLVSLVVALRRRELGIRAALGATPARLRRQVLADTIGTALVATVAGVVGALILGRLVAGLLVGTPPYDPVSLAGAALLTLMAGLAGCLLPAHRAAVRDPTDVLRD